MIFDILALILGIGLSANMAAHPLAIFVTKINEIRKSKNFDKRLPLKGPKEFFDLAYSFNKLTMELSETTVSKEHLEDLVKMRTQKLEQTQQELVNKAIEAGRAQLSAMVLHNIGNAITPLKVQIDNMDDSTITNIQQYLEKCYLDLKTHREHLGQYVIDDPRGKKVFSYMGDLIDTLNDAVSKLIADREKQRKTIAYVSEILSLQQTYAASEKEIKELVDLNTVIESAITIQTDACEKREITLTKELIPDLPRPLIDKNRLIQVVINLIKNSYEAIDELPNSTGEKKIHIKTFTENNRVGFEIKDSGIGIDATQMESMFEFGQSGKGSSGMGLYYCKMFVENNSGDLTLTSLGKAKGSIARVVFKVV